MSEEPMRTGANPAEPRLLEQVPLPEVAHIPDATELLLNALMAEGLAILRDAGALYRSCPYDPAERGLFVNHSVSLMQAGAKLGSMVARLKNGDTKPEIRQRFTVEHITHAALPGEQAGEGGIESPKNE